MRRNLLKARKIFTNNSTLPRLPPSRLVDIQGLDPLVGNTNESPMNIQFTVPEQPREQGQCVTGQRLIDKWFLTFQRFRCTATRSGVFIECSVRDLGKEFAGRAKPVRTPRIASVPWLAEDELSAVGAVT